MDPLLDVVDETATMLGARLYETGVGSFHPGSLQVYEMPGNILLYEGGELHGGCHHWSYYLGGSPSPNTSMSVDYRYAGTSTGPFPLPENGAT